tara:strand:- start:112 stop:1104 length:993 start_codon:yes stop_codon:yes gene_type:complete
MNENRFYNFKKTITNKEYGKYWTAAKKTFDIDFKNNSFVNKGSRNYFPEIYDPKFDDNDLLDVNFENNEDKKILKLGTKNLCLLKKSKNRTLIYAQDYLKSIDSCLKEKDIVCEVGSGSGLLSALINEKKKTTNILIDIPDVLLTAISLIFTLFPNKVFLLPNEIKELSLPINFNQYDFIFLTPDMTHYVQNESVKLGINTQSFMEMDMIEVDNYLNYFEKIILDKGYFFCSNRIRKRHYFFEYKFYLLKNFKKVFLKKNQFFYSSPNLSSMLDFLLKKDMNLNKKSINFSFFEKIIILSKFKPKEFLRWLIWDFQRLFKKINTMNNIFS